MHGCQIWCVSKMRYKICNARVPDLMSIQNKIPNLQCVGVRFDEYPVMSIQCQIWWVSYETWMRSAKLWDTLLSERGILISEICRHQSMSVFICRVGVTKLQVRQNSSRAISLGSISVTFSLYLEVGVMRNSTLRAMLSRSLWVTFSFYMGIEVTKLQVRQNFEELNPPTSAYVTVSLYIVSELRDSGEP